MEAEEKLQQFNVKYSDVKAKLDYLLSDVMDGRDGFCDPDQTNRKKLAEAVCDMVEKEARKKELTIVGMRAFVDKLGDQIRAMITMQRAKDSQRHVSYASVIRKVNTMKPDKGK